MGVGSRDIFGDDVAQRATRDSYGLRPSGYRLPNATHPGPVQLQVANLERSLAYYTDVLGMRVLDRDDVRATLGPHDDDRVLVGIHARDGVRSARQSGRLGLYHFAILLPERAALGGFIQHLAQRGVYAGSADHLVSEALYLTDPDGLGIEVYADRPREEWRRVERELMMATDPIDVQGLLRAAGGAPWHGMPAGTVMGHVHLHVGDIDQGRAFYADALGFDRTVWSYPGALFLAAGGYHHHLGTNTWAGRAATPSDESEAQLLEWTLEVPSASDVTAIRDNLAAAGFHASTENGDIIIRDPWHTTLRVRSGS